MLRTTLLWTRSPLLWMSVFLLATGIVANWASGQSDGLSVGGDSNKIQREGTKIESQPARCRTNGDRLVLELVEGEEPVVALENLAAQRILEAVNDDPEDNYWSVNGVLTEFQGRNFLLLKRVNRASRE